MVGYSFFPKQENFIDLTFLILILKVQLVQYYYCFFVLKCQRIKIKGKNFNSNEFKIPIPHLHEEDILNFFHS